MGPFSPLYWSLAGIAWWVLYVQEPRMPLQEMSVDRRSCAGVNCTVWI